MPNKKNNKKNANKTVKAVRNPLTVIPRGMGTGLFNKSFVPKKPSVPKRRTRRRSSRSGIMPRIMYE